MTDKYLYEIMDDYKHAALAKEKDALFQTFCSSIWENCCKQRLCPKEIRFKVKKELLQTPIGQVFQAYSKIEYMGYQAMSEETDWRSLLCQKLSNLYTKYFDKEVILNREYLYLLHTPKRLYCNWLKGNSFTPEEALALIKEAMEKAEQKKAVFQNQKMELSWQEYKQVAEGFLRKLFDCCKLLDHYEKASDFYNIYDFMNEDNFYVRYFCKSLEAYMKNYTKEYYGLKRGRNKKYIRCSLCGSLIERTGPNTRYCTECRRNRRLQTKRAWLKRAC